MPKADFPKSTPRFARYCAMALLCGALLLLAACNVLKPRTEADVLGYWHGCGIYGGMMLFFSPDHTFYMGADHNEWSFLDGKYVLLGEEMTGTINMAGHLVLRDTKPRKDEDPEVLEFERDPQAAPADVAAYLKKLEAAPFTHEFWGQKP